jgi:hypothetical protein
VTAAPHPIRLLHHLARTGGTVISRCLGCMDGVVLLSEIHPQGGRYFDPLRQAQEWFGLLTPAELGDIRARGALPFDAAIALIEQRCRERGRQLVIRDWSHLDFTGVPFVRRPSFEPALARALAARFAVTSLATVRHPVDQWLSLQQVELMQDRIAIEPYLQGCCRFARHAAAMGFVRYEDFLAEPAAAMGDICTRLGLPFDAGFIDRWYGYRYVTGDTDSAALTRIAAPKPRSYAPDLLARFADNADYRETLERLGYRHPSATPGG